MLLVLPLSVNQVAALVFWSVHSLVRGETAPMPSNSKNVELKSDVWRSVRSITEDISADLHIGRLENEKNKRSGIDAHNKIETKSKRTYQRLETPDAAEDVFGESRVRRATSDHCQTEWLDPRDRFARPRGEGRAGRGE